MVGPDGIVFVAEWPAGLYGGEISFVERMSPIFV